MIKKRTTLAPSSLGVIYTFASEPQAAKIVVSYSDAVSVRAFEMLIISTSSGIDWSVYGVVGNILPSDFDVINNNGVFELRALNTHNADVEYLVIPLVGGIDVSGYF